MNKILNLLIQIKNQKLNSVKRFFLEFQNLLTKIFPLSAFVIFLFYYYILMEKEQNSRLIVHKESEVPNILQVLESHPYNYLSCLNNLYNYYDQHQSLNNLTKFSKSHVNIKPFKKMNIPQAFYQNYMQQKQNLQSNVDFIVRHQKQQINKRLWKQHQELLSRYKIKQKKSIQQAKYHYTEEQQNRIFANDRKNVFLKRLIKSGKIPKFDSKKLQKEVIEKLKGLKQPTIVEKRHLKTSETLKRCKTMKRQKSILSNMRYNPKQKEKLSKFSSQFDLELKKTFNYKNYDEKRLKSQINEFVSRGQMLKQIDVSISCQNIKKVRNFVNYIKELQNKI